MNRVQSPLPISSIQERFERYHRDHPEVFACLVHLAYEVKGKGFRHYGIKSLFERVRWHFQIEQGLEEFKLNNNYHSRYARLIIQEFPDLDGFFELRDLQAP